MKIECLCMMKTMDGSSVIDKGHVQDLCCKYVMLCFTNENKINHARKSECRLSYANPFQHSCANNKSDDVRYEISLITMRGEAVRLSG